VSINRTAKGIVLVPSLLLGGAFMAAGVWVDADGPAAANRPLALGLGAVLMAAGLIAQLLPEPGSAVGQQSQSSSASSSSGKPKA